MHSLLEWNLLSVRSSTMSSMMVGPKPALNALSRCNTQEGTLLCPLTLSLLHSPTKC